MRTVQRGFSLIELMIVVAIIGILSALAIPSYLDYIARTKVIEALNWLGGAKASIATHFSEGGTWPSYLEQAGIADEVVTNYIADVTLGDESVVVVRFHNIHANVDGQTLRFQPIKTPAGAIRWSCTEDDIPHSYLPSVCRHDAN